VTLLKPVCLVIGAGAGIGGTVGKRFAQESYHAVLCRRTDEEGLNRTVADIEAEGNSATGFLLNAIDENSIEERVAAVEADIGPIEVALYNLGAQIGDRALKDTSYKAFEMGWQMATFGLFRLASAVCPHTAAMAGRRMLCQSLNAEFSSKGIHVAHIVIDGAVDAPDTLGKMLGPEKYQQLRETRGDQDGLMLPERIADTYLHLARQHRSTWTFEIDMRSFSDRPWWNH
jgi:NAD(P)-dependent dehydrogenase (short-subunit alcohol dehydrogenase family)